MEWALLMVSFEAGTPDRDQFDVRSHRQFISIEAALQRPLVRLLVMSHTVRLSFRCLHFEICRGWLVPLIEHRFDDNPIAIAEALNKAVNGSR